MLAEIRMRNICSDLHFVQTLHYPSYQCERSLLILSNRALWQISTALCFLPTDLQWKTRRLSRRCEGSKNHMLFYCKTKQMSGARL